MHILEQVFYFVKRQLQSTLAVPGTAQAAPLHQQLLHAAFYQIASVC